MKAALAMAIVLATAPLTTRTVDVGGAPIRVVCGGARAPGAPVVVLEAGAGNGAETWAKVQPDIASFARVCAYDRPALVRNKPERPATPTPEAMVGTLDGVLTAAGEAPPYVLVGHSLGGMIVRMYASRFPERLAGMVLVDSSHEEQLRRFAEANPQQANAPPAATRGEAFDLPAMSDALRARAWRTNAPLVVLTHTSQPGVRNDAIWLDLQRELATRSPNASHVVAEHSGHYIQNDEPALVIDAVRRIVDQGAHSK